MRSTDTKQAIRHTFFRLGLHTPARAIADALAQQGVQVTEELVRQAGFEMQKQTTGARVVKVSRPVRSTGVPRRPQGFPGWRGRATGEVHVHAV